jgi:hypothetical protein
MDLPDPSADAQARLTAARAAYAALRPRVEAGGPWPLAEHFGKEPESSWGPREVLAHLGEMLTYWLGEYERIVEGGRGPGDGVPFGRTTADAMRVGILERDRTVPLRELFGRIDAGIARWEARLAEAAPEEGSAVGLHPRLGEMTAGAVVGRMILAHLDEHRDQLEGILGGR